MKARCDSQKCEQYSSSTAFLRTQHFERTPLTVFIGKGEHRESMNPFISPRLPSSAFPFFTPTANAVEGLDRYADPDSKNQQSSSTGCANEVEMLGEHSTSEI